MYTLDEDDTRSDTTTTFQSFQEMPEQRFYYANNRRRINLTIIYNVCKFVTLILIVIGLILLSFTLLFVQVHMREDPEET
mmetsp:Transcript_7474/g.11080  ORF Transcript_7474/g.11080 Transcript_7474/m.11080 type:complete len:80 (+) Transcript_7474:90-329(+)